MSDKKVIDVSDADIIKYDGDYYGLKQLKWAHDWYSGYNDRIIQAKTLNDLKREDCLVLGYVEGQGDMLFRIIQEKLRFSPHKCDIMSYIKKKIEGELNAKN